MRATSPSSLTPRAIIATLFEDYPDRQIAWMLSGYGPDVGPETIARVRRGK